MSMFIGEALVGEGNEIAHIDLIVGSKDGPAGIAFANALARQSEGHSNLLAVLEPNLAVKPATVMVTKVTIKGAKQAVQMFGPAQAAVAQAVADSVADGVIPRDKCEEYVITCGVFIHWEAEDNKKIYQYNYEATKMALANAMHGKPSVDEMLAGKDRLPIRLRASDSIRADRMAKPKILIQLDPDPHASVFDAVVAIDAGVDHLLSYAAVRVEDITSLVHGAMFTRGPDELRSTAIFIGGTDVTRGEQLLQAVLKTFFGPLRVSVMLDANGANTTAAAAVVAAGRHLPLAGASALVLAGTGPVGRRAARLLAGAGAEVRLGSRSLDRARAACEQIQETAPAGRLSPWATADVDSVRAALTDAQLLIAAGAAGVELAEQKLLQEARDLRVAIDLNAVPPLGLGGLEVTDSARDRQGVICYGAIGVGGTKMKIHKAALRRLFQDSQLVLDAEEIYAIGGDLESGSA